MIEALIHSFAVCPDMDYNYPRIDHGKDVYLYDEDGKAYLDASSGSCAVSNLGHGRKEIAQAMQQQIEKIAVLPTHSFNATVVQNYLQALVQFAGPAYAKAWTSMSGTEAVENAVKLACQYFQLTGQPGKHKVIARHSSYHGNSVFMLDVGGFKARRELYAKWLNDFPHLSPAYTFRMEPHQTEEAYCQALLQEFEALIEKEGAHTIAAFVVEPIVGAALGAAMPPKGYLKGMQELCRRHNIVFIADEVLTGFGRTGKNFGFEHFEVQPDIIATGKGISGGYFPLSAIIVTPELAQPFASHKQVFYGGHTFACNPVGAVAGQKVLDILQQEKLVQNAATQGRYLKERLQALAQKHTIIADVRGHGLLIGLELLKDPITKQPFDPSLQLAKNIGRQSCENGVVLYPGQGQINGMLRDHILICPPLTVQKEHIDTIVNTLDLSMEQVTNQLLNTHDYE